MIGCLEPLPQPTYPLAQAIEQVDRGERDENPKTPRTWLRRSRVFLGQEGRLTRAFRTHQADLQSLNGQSPRRCLDRVTTLIGVPVNSTSSRSRFSMKRR